VTLSDSVDLLSATEEEAGQPVPIGTRDPHFWLDPVEYEKGAVVVMRALIDADPAHASVYRTNFDRLKKNLDELDMRFQSISASACRQDTVVVSHNAFSYLARRYGFTVRSLAGIDPSQEVSVGTLSDTIRFMREKHIRYVLGESLGNVGIADTVGKEASVEILRLNPLEGLLPSDLSSGKNYLTVMNENWITLRKALECE
jgi:zinc transport system substrate-binding protein